jgi:hypothetical protein
MNSEFSDDMDILSLERELQSLTPVAPSHKLVQAMKARMEPVPRRVQPAAPRIAAFPWRRMVAPAAAAAAAVAVMNMDGAKRGGKSGSVAVASNEPSQAVTWEPMPMLPKYRKMFDLGYVFTGDFDVRTGEPNFIEPELAGFYQQMSRRWQFDSGSARGSFAGSNRYVVPDGHGTPAHGTPAMNFQWK